MKKCPKCNGRKYIENYHKVDGGLCYECNGKGWVSDNHKTYIKPKIYDRPDWLKQKEQAVIDAYQDEVKTAKEAIREVLQCKKTYATAVWEHMSGIEQKEFLKILQNSNEHNIEEYVNTFYNINKDDIEEF